MLDPATIATLISILGPLLKDCFEDKTQGELVTIVAKPNLRQRRLFLRQVPVRERKQLKVYWKDGKNQRLSRRTAWVIVKGALRKGA